MQTDCKSKGLTDSQRALCACLDATQTFKKAFEMYIKDLKKYNENTKSYKEWKKAWNDWNSKTGGFDVYKNHGVNAQFWANDHDGTCWWGENWNSAHQWCHDMASAKGLDGKHYWARKWGMCKGRYGNFLCGKPDETVTKQLLEYANAEPKAWLGLAEPTPPQPVSGNNIMCCSQLFEDIKVNGGNADFSNVIQNCLQKITTKLTKNDTSSSSSSPNTPNAPSTQNTPNTPPPPSSQASNPNILTANSEVSRALLVAAVAG